MTKQEVRKAWVKALRSGQYKQGQHSLCTNKRYCCLGVLAELAVQYGVAKKLSNLYDGREGFLSSGIMDWVGLQTDSGRYMKGYNTTSLALMNDQGMSFTDIADIIESNPPDLFV